MKNLNEGKARDLVKFHVEYLKLEQSCTTHENIQQHHSDYFP